ncbi:MAG TPA: FkbM family methyltransferase [Pyrinomonadaceae bacterium]|jgi:FkbM family methyltransferase
MVSTLIKVAKWGRASQPFNGLATSTLKTFLKATRLHSEFIIKHLPRSGVAASKLPNGRLLRLRSHGDDWISTQVFWREWFGYEPETAPLFYRLATRARVTLDVGAHIGFYALLAAHANPDGSVYAFEPMPVTYKRLERNIELNKLTNVYCINSALGESEGEADIFFEGEICSGATLSTEIKRLIPTLNSSAVPVITLDGFVREKALEYIDLVKIDTETTEEQVLLGMSESLERFHPNIICEVWGGEGMENWGGPKRIMDNILTRLGYRCYVFTPDGLVPYEEGNENLNYLFTTLNPDEVSQL